MPLPWLTQHSIGPFLPARVIQIPSPNVSRAPNRAYANKTRCHSAAHRHHTSAEACSRYFRCFASLSGQKFAALAPEYVALKGRLIGGHEGAVRESWERLPKSLREEIPLILELGSKVIPEIDFAEIDDAPGQFSRELSAAPCPRRCQTWSVTKAAEPWASKNGIPVLQP
jgi:hypothetical protein